MASIFGIVAQYKDRLSMLPVAVLFFAVATLVLYMLFHKNRWVKYAPAFLGVVLGIFFLANGIFHKAEIAGLESLWRGIYFFVAGCIALATAWLSALIESFSKHSTKKAEKPRKKVN